MVNNSVHWALQREWRKLIGKIDEAEASVAHDRIAIAGKIESIERMRANVKELESHATCNGWVFELAPVTIDGCNGLDTYPNTYP